MTSNHAPRLEEMQDGRHPREAQLAHEYRCIQARIALFRLYHVTAFPIGIGERSDDCVRVQSVGACETSRTTVGHTDSQNDLVARMLLEVVVPRELLPTERTALAVVERAEQAASTESLPDVKSANRQTTRELAAGYPGK